MFHGILDCKSHKQMELINNIEQLRNNITQFEKYLASDNGDEERIKRLDLIRRGRNFVAYKVEGEYRFAPSRFLGYINNTISSGFIGYPNKIVVEFMRHLG